MFWNRKPKQKPVAPKRKRFVSHSQLHYAREKCVEILSDIGRQFTHDDPDYVTVRWVGDSVISGAQVCWPVYEQERVVHPYKYLQSANRSADTLFWMLSETLAHYARWDRIGGLARGYANMRILDTWQLQCDVRWRHFGERRKDIIHSASTRQAAAKVASEFPIVAHYDACQTLEGQLRDAILEVAAQDGVGLICREVLRSAANKERLDEADCERLLTDTKPEADAGT